MFGHRGCSRGARQNLDRGTPRNRPEKTNVKPISALLLFASIGMGPHWAAPSSPSPHSAGHAAPVRSIPASALGLRPDPIRDATEAFMRAIQGACSNGGPVELVLEEGVYRIGGPAVEPTSRFFVSALNLKGLKGLTLRGAGPGTLILVTKPWLGFLSANGCADIALKDFAIDYETPAFTQGLIETVDGEKGCYTLRLDPGFPEFDSPLFNPPAKENWLKRGVIYESRVAPDGQRLVEYHGTAASTAVEKISDRLWRIQLGPWGSTWVPGKETGWTHKKGWTNWHIVPGATNLIQNAPMSGGFWFSKCTNTLFERIVAYASPSVFIRVFDSERLTLRACEVRVAPGSRRLQSVNADILICSEVRGPVLIEDCRFADQGDDQVTVAGALDSAVLSAPAPGQLELDWGARGYRAGDAIELIDQERKVLRGKAVVVKVEARGEKTFLVTVAPPLPGARVKYAPADTARSNADKRCDTVWNPAAAGGPVVIRRNHFVNGGSVWVYAIGALIEGNTFERNGDGRAIGIAYGNYARCSEGPSPSEITIRSNTFRNEGRLHGNSPVVAVHYWPANPPQARFTRGLRIEGNRFIDCGTGALYLRGVSNAQILGNIVETRPGTRRSAKLEAWHAAMEVEGEGYAALFLDNCENVLVDRLTVKDGGVKAAVMIGPGAEAGTLGVLIRDLKASLGPQAVPIIDLRESK